MRAGGRGFTLVELLVAISILAIVAVLGWRGLDGIVRARVALTAQMEQTRGMQLVYGTTLISAMARRRRRMINAPPDVAGYW